MNKKGQTPLSKTAYEAWNTKLSASQVYKDEVVPENIVGSLRNEISRQSPLLHRFYSLRSRIIHNALDCVIESIEKSKGFQILLLGGGLDVSYEQRYPHSKCFVVDVADVIQARKPLQSLNTIGIEGDLKDWNTVWANLVDVGLNPNIPTVILVESVSAYLPAGVPATILSSITSLVPICFLLFFDVCFSRAIENGFAEMLYTKFNTKQAPLLSVFSPRELHSLLYAANFTHANILTMHEASCLLLREKITSQAAALEPFDEHTSLLHLLSLYCLSLASNSSDWYDSVQKKLCAGQEYEAGGENRLAAERIRCRVSAAERRVRALEMLVKSRVTSHDKKDRCREVRAAKPNDQEAFAAVYTACLEPYVRGDKSVRKYVQSAVKKISVLIAEGSEGGAGARLWVSTDKEGRVVGGVALKRTKGGRNKSESPSSTSSSEDVVFELSLFCVESTSRGQGVGGNLLTKALGEARERGAHRVELTVLEHMTEARHVYSRHNFVEVGKDVLSPLCTLVHMQCDLRT
eukprot:gene25708-31043_t